MEEYTNLRRETKKSLPSSRDTARFNDHTDTGGDASAGEVFLCLMAVLLAMSLRASHNRLSPSVSRTRRPNQRTSLSRTDSLTLKDWRLLLFFD